MPAANARKYGAASLFVATSSKARKVFRRIAGACLGFSFDPTATADHTSACVNGQSTPKASDQTDDACLAAAGTVLLLSANDSR